MVSRMHQIAEALDARPGMPSDRLTPRNPVLDMDPWRELYARIMGDSATKQLALRELGDRTNQFPDPRMIICRPVVASIVIDPAITNVYQGQWTFDTLTIINGISAQLFEGDATDHLGKYSIIIQQGAGGGTVLGTTASPTNLAGCGNIPQQAGGEPRHFQPVATTDNNPFPYTITAAGVTAVANVMLVVNLYGVSLRGPGGQIH